MDDDDGCGEGDGYHDGGGSEGDGDDDSDGEGDCMSAPIKGINLTGGIHSKMPPIWLQFKIKLCQLSRI